MRSAEQPLCACGAAIYTPVLSGRHDRLLVEDYRFDVVRCDACALARTLPVPDPAQYDDGYSQTTVNGRFAGPTEDRHSPLIAAWIAERARGPRLLDVGCHVGNLVVAAAELGLDAEGIDLDPLATAEARRIGRPVLTGPLDSATGRYHGISMIHVLEHVLDLGAFLAAAERVLEPGGRLFILSPNYRGLLPRLMGERWMGWFPSQHVWHFTPATFRRTVEGVSGFRVVSCTTRGVIGAATARG
jgi:SAM-dependent methyltransferase